MYRHRTRPTADLHLTPTPDPATSGVPGGSRAVRSLERTKSPAMQRFCATLRALARHPSMPVLIEGEQGTGKSLVARALHDLSARHAARYKEVETHSLPLELAHSMLFGHVAGAYTGAQGKSEGFFAWTNHGTVFLDEIAKAHAVIQGMLLRVVEDGTIQPLGAADRVHVDVRIVAATNVSLAALVETDRFLPDLYGRLFAGWIRLPPLRERTEDIPDLIHDAILEASRRIGVPRVPEPSDALLRACLSHSWPGNIRELATTFERIVVEAVVSPTSVLTPRHVPPQFGLAQAIGIAKPPRLTHEEIIDAVRFHGGRVSDTARRTGLHRATIFRHLRRESLKAVALGSHPHGSRSSATTARRPASSPPP